MASQVIMPKMGYDMTEGVVARWLKKPGDEVKKGEAIAEIETDKVTIEIESFSDGKLARLLAREGDRIPVGQAIAEIDTGEVTPTRQEMKPVGAGEGGDAVPETQQAGAGAAMALEQKCGPGACRGEDSGATEGETTAAPVARFPLQAGGTLPGGKLEPVAPRERTGRIKASPLARKLAEEAGLPLQEVPGSGPGGRIVRDDVEAALSERKTAPSPTKSGERPPTLRRPVTPSPRPPAAPRPGIPRKLGKGQSAVARVMTLSKQTIPHFTVSMAVDMAPALTFRAELNAQRPDERRLSVNDLIVKATALALHDAPELTHLWGDDGLIPADGIHVAIAVAVDDGIISPVIHDADRLPLVALARRSRQLIQDARAGKLSRDSLEGGIFTVSNLGASGVDQFTAIITPPQSGVLAVGATLDEAVVKDGRLVAGKRLQATLSADHRLLGGREGAAFLARFKTLMENPFSLLVDAEVE